MKRPTIGTHRIVLRLSLPLTIAFFLLSSHSQLMGQQIATPRFNWTYQKVSSGECELNAPLSNENSTVGKVSSTESSTNQSTTSWVVKKGNSLMLTTSELKVVDECPSCSTCSTPPCCDSRAQCSTAKSESCSKQCSQEKYCTEIATHLATTLVGSQESSAAQKRAINTALKMVSENAEAVADARIAAIELAHQDAMKSMREKLTSAKTERPLSTPPTSAEFLYAAQYRNAKQIQSLTAANRTLLGAMKRLESHFASFALSQRAKLSDSEVQRMISSAEENERYELEVEKLQAELETLDQRIRQLQLKPSQVRPASFLEPVYNRENPLTPIRRTIKR